MKTVSGDYLRVATGVVGLGGILVITLGMVSPHERIGGSGVVPAPFLDPCVAGLLGDVTDDGNANVVDAQQIARASAGLSVSATVAGRLASHGDITGDGNSNVIDAQQVARSSAGLAVTFPIGDPMCGIEVTTTTTGVNLDPDGYSLELDAAPAGDIDLDETVELTGLDVGTYQVAILGLAANCAVINGTATRDVEVAEGLTAATTFEVQCTTSAVTLRVNNATEGSNQPASYTVTLDGADEKVMNVNDFVEYPDLAPGTYQVTIAGVPGNCTLNESPTQEAVIDGTEVTEQVGYGINCT